ncbi:MAG: hypothetical protein IT566_07415 [Rhodospirillaceae bacterium]|nr:hypothetical protein [Rhodospirillaceae bacterium]
MIRDAFPHIDDLTGAIEDIEALMAWQSTNDHDRAPIEVRDAVRIYLGRLQADIAGLDWNPPVRADVMAEIERARVLRSWQKSGAGQGALMQVGFAVEAALDEIGELLAETRSSDPRVLLAQAMLLAETFASHPMREGTLSRSLLAGLADARA